MKSAFAIYLAPGRLEGSGRNEFFPTIQLFEYQDGRQTKRRAVATQKVRISFT